LERPLGYLAIFYLEKETVLIPSGLFSIKRLIPHASNKILHERIKGALPFP
jgi:hypothetical protein